MTLYADTSALLKRYVEEDDSDLAVELLDSDPTLVTDATRWWRSVAIWPGFSQVRC